MRKLILLIATVCVMAVANVASADPTGMVWVSINDPGFNGQMSKYETTNAQYCEFLTAAKASGDITVSGNDVISAYDGQLYYDGDGPGDTENGATNGGAARINYSGGVFSVDSGFENHPVTYVSWYGATAFCNYYGYRLPTEWEWQAVADYDGSFNYGSGESISNTMANYAGSTHPDGTTAVGAFGMYGYGLADLSGNVWEWTSSVLSTPRYGWCVVCGGCWNGPESICTVWNAGDYHPSFTFSYLGFRVAQVPEPAVAATVDIDPDTLNLQSKGKWITCHIAFPADANVADVNSNTILLNDQVKAEWTMIEEEAQVLMAKFSRSAVEDILQPGIVELTVSGKLNDGTRFEGKDTITVINKGKP